MEQRKFVQKQFVKVGPAEVEITDLSYDDTVKYALEMSKKYGWILIQDTSWDGYEKIPTWIIQGYLTMAYEITEELEKIKCNSYTYFFTGRSRFNGWRNDCIFCRTL